MTKAFVHPTTVVDPDVEIGAGTKIWHFCHLLSRTQIGKNCVLGQNVAVGPDVTIGANCKIQNNVSVFKGVTLEDDVFCGPSMVFTNVMTPRAFVERKDEFRETRVGKGASIGANATIICGTTIGRYSMIGAGAVVTKDVSDYSLVVGNPARHIGWVSKNGDRLGDDLKCPATGVQYEIIKNKLTEAKNDRPLANRAC
jgi:UDP-2-acetamido-3-amino-2,3-dideoxy-glucuronate N-acetyltransferase